MNHPTLTPAQQAALDKWSAVVFAYSEIESFFGWLAGEGKRSLLGQVPLWQLLDEFYGIDRVELEGGRRALLAEARGEIGQ